MSVQLQVASAEPYVIDGWVDVTATADIVVEPADPRWAAIVDIDRARRDPGDGLVHAVADVRLIRPADGRAAGLVTVIPNRGMTGALPFSVGVSAADAFMAGTNVLPGDGFLLDRGFAVAWVGWQWDVLRAPGRLGIDVPEALGDDRRPIAGDVRVEFRPDQLAATHALGDSTPLFAFATYPADDPAQPDAQLRVRTSPHGPSTVVPRDAWQFVDGADEVALDGGFLPFHTYELVYRTSRCPVAGLGLVAVAEVVSALRRELQATTSIAFGVSQSGRFLREFLRCGLNADHAFDGVFAHIAGARTGEFNHRYAQPSLTHVMGFGNRPPYAGEVFAAARGESMPRVFATNTSSEYWRGDASLLHIAPDGSADLPPDPDVRHYLVSGVDHLGDVPLKDLMPLANPVNPNDGTLLLRALFVALAEWCGGVEPPAERVPRVADGTAVPRSTVLDSPAFAEAARPDPAVLPVTPEIDLGPSADAGIGRWPLVEGPAATALVSAVDADGNEVAGVRLPQVAAPLGAFTGWNPRAPRPDLPDVAYEFAGSFLARSADELIARFGDRHGYEAAALAAADRLVAERFLLPADRDRAVRRALRRWDAAPDAG